MLQSLKPHDMEAHSLTSPTAAQLASKEKTDCSEYRASDENVELHIPRSYCLYCPLYG